MNFDAKNYVHLRKGQAKIGLLPPMTPGPRRTVPHTEDPSECPGCSNPFSTEAAIICQDAWMLGGALEIQTKQK